LLGKAETGAEVILHSVTILVKPYLHSPVDNILGASARVLQTNRHAARGKTSSGFLNSSPDLSRLLTDATKAPRFVMLTFFAGTFLRFGKKTAYHFETELISNFT
jgi:hypothetical protein